jgi:hypothetical protein
MGLFRLPSLAPLNGQAPPIGIGDGAAIELPYEGVVDLVTVDLVLEQLLPLHRAFILGGFDIAAVSIGLSPDGSEPGTRPTAWLRADLATGAVTLGDGGAARYVAWHDGLAVILWLTSRKHATTFLDFGFDFLAGLTGEDANLGWVALYREFPLVILLGARPTTPGQVIDALAFEVERLTAASVTGLVDAWKRGQVTPEPGNGLLWLFDPTHWYDVGPQADWLPGGVLGSTAAALFAAVSVEPTDFVRGELAGDRRLVDVLGVLYPRRGDARAQARKVIADILLLADTLGGLLDKAVRQELDRLPWFEILLHLVHAGVIAPPALPASYDLDADDEEPLQPRWAPEVAALPLVERSKLELFVCPAGQKVVIERVHVLDGAPFDQTFTWEYFEDDPAGPSLLVVAGPGIRITPPDEPLRGWRLEIIRVQSFGVIPPWGERIERAHLTTPFARAEPADIDEHALLLLTPRADGLTLRHPGNNDASEFWELTFTLDPYSPDQRISYTVEETPPPEERGADQPLSLVRLSMVVSPGVHVACWSTPGYGQTVDDFDVHRFDFHPGIVWLFEADLADIGPPGFPIPSTWDGLRARKPDAFDLEWTGTYVDAALMAFDTALGFIPIVGDVADAYELFTIVVYGEDKWGRPATAFDFVITAGSVVVPFASSGFLRGLGRKALDVATETVP